MNRMNSTRFLEVEELRTQLKKVDLYREDYPAGGVPLSASHDSAWIDTQDSHTIVFGATGSKKTRMLVLPTIEILSRAGESFVVTDPKGEVYERTSGTLEDRGYRVYALNLRDYEAGDAWNPLRLPYQYYKGGDVPKAVELVSSIAAMLVPNDTDDAYWSNTARDLAIGLILLLFEEAEREAECNIKSLLGLWQKYLNDKKGFRKMIRQKYAGSLIGDKMQCIDNASDRTVGSVEAVFATGLNRFSTNGKMINYLSQPGIRFEDMTEGRAAVYLIVPDENKFYHFIVSLFLEQLYEVLIKKAQTSAKTRLANRINFIIDEFANLPTIENIDCMITASRSRNIRFVLIVQSMSQLTEKYGETAQVICSNCNNWIYLYSKEFDLLTQISRLCGEVIYDNNMHMPLISEFDLQHLDKDKGEALVLCGRNYPCLVNLLDIDEYPFERKEGLKKHNVWPQAEELKEGRGEKAGGGEILKELLDANGFQPSADPEPYAGEVLSFLGDTWMVATYGGMILKEYYVKGLRLKNEIAVMEKSLLDFDTWEAAHIEWYMGYVSLGECSKKYLQAHPDLVYLTVEEVNALGKKNHHQLYPLKNAVAEWRPHFKNREIRSEETCCISLVYTVSGIQKEEVLETQNALETNIGITYLHRLAFRLANRKLQGTPLQGGRWGNGERVKNPGKNDRTVSYTKTAKNGDEAKLLIRTFEEEKE